MYGGMCQAPYFKSCLELQEAFLTNGLDFDFLITTNESLITRARNTSVAKFLKTDFEYMMFIDGDIEFSPDDVAKLWNLEADVCCGAYPMKKMGKGTTAWKDGVQVPLEEFKEVTPIDYAGTGFLMISRKAIEKMIESYPETKHEESIGDCWALFDTEIKHGVYLSEDYSFCDKWREIGGEILLDPSIKLKHYGMYGY
jgi:hypothetical protein